MAHTDQHPTTDSTRKPGVEVSEPIPPNLVEAARLLLRWMMEYASEPAADAQQGSDDVA